MTANEKNKYKNLTIEICDTKVNDPYIFVSYSRSNELYVKKALNDLDRYLSPPSAKKAKTTSKKFY